MAAGARAVGVIFFWNLEFLFLPVVCTLRCSYSPCCTCSMGSVPASVHCASATARVARVELAQCPSLCMTLQLQRVLHACSMGSVHDAAATARVARAAWAQCPCLCMALQLQRVLHVQHGLSARVCAWRFSFSACCTCNIGSVPVSVHDAAATARVARATLAQCPCVCMTLQLQRVLHAQTLAQCPCLCMTLQLQRVLYVQHWLSVVSVHDAAATARVARATLAQFNTAG